jgi:hypothetical protein
MTRGESPVFISVYHNALGAVLPGLRLPEHPGITRFQPNGHSADKQSLRNPDHE